MANIIRKDINEEYAYSGIVVAGDYAFVTFCVGNVGQPIERQINGALDMLVIRLESVGLSLDSVVQVDALFRDVWDIPVMERVFHERFNGNYPARKSLQTEFAHRGGQDGLLFQLDAIAFAGDANGVTDND